MSKKKMTLKEFAERYECCYSAAGVRLKKLIAKDRKFAKHVSRKGRIYLLDEYAAELLKPKTTKKTSVLIPTEDISTTILRYVLTICTGSTGTPTKNQCECAELSPMKLLLHTGLKLSNTRRKATATNTASTKRGKRADRGNRNCVTILTMRL